MKRLSPPRLIFLTFAAAIAIGSISLYVEGARSDRPLEWVDAVFTATSATCVTGLVVRDTGGDFSFAGQVVILVLIQLGGLGILTLSSWFLLMLGRRPSFSERTAVTESFGMPTHISWRGLLGRAIVYTILIETIGAFLLYVRFSALYPERAAYLSIFHSISAFCNAGFALFSTSLVKFANDPWINTIFIALIVLGGLGFYVLEEIRAATIERLRGRKWRWSLHARVVLSMTAFLIVAGFIGIFALESTNVETSGHWSESLLPSLFLSVSSRTAGFNSVDMGELTNGTLSIIILLMIVGASPGGTGGGIKTTTIAILAAMIGARIRGRRDVEIAERRIPSDLVAKALAVTLAFLACVALCTIALQITELGGQPHAEMRGDFLELAFESVSALGTVGLSLGVTPTLTIPGKLIITLAMLAGRLGPLTFALSLIGERRSRPYQYPEERVMIG